MKTVRNAYLGLGLLTLVGCANDQSQPQTPSQPSDYPLGAQSPSGTDTSGSQMGSNTGPGYDSTMGQAGSQTGSTMGPGSGSTLDNQGSQMGPGTMGSTQGGPTSGTVNQGGTGTSDSAGESAPLNDEQVLQVLHVANQGEVEQARLALQKAKDPRVKRFAQMMVSEHTTADTKASRLVTKRRLTMADSTLASSIQDEGKRAVEQLRSASTDFDRTYMDAQVTQHQKVLDAIDRRLLPSAKESDVRELVQNIRPKIANHLKEAQEIQASLATK